jgi:inward rectifier potassium channel
MSANQGSTVQVKRFPTIRELGKWQRIAHRQVAGFDVYHHIMAVSWPVFFALLAAAYIAFNFAFGLLYLIEPGSLANARPGSIADVFFYSVHAMAAQGYRDVRAATLYADLLVTGEVMCGMTMVAFITSLVFARFSRPKAGVVFSSYAVICHTDGEPTLLIRAANQRNNLVMDAKASVVLVRTEVSAEGNPRRRFIDLALVRDHVPIWMVTWTFMHRIDKSSPLYGLTRDDLIAQEAEFNIALTGIDETLALLVCAQHSYTAKEVLWNHQYADVLGVTKDGSVRVDFSHLHETKPVST